MTQEKIDKLADVIWWLEGFLGAKDNCDYYCAIGREHINALIDARIELSRMDKEKGRV